jgi:uncharacterized protein (TIGR02466 family)
MPSKTHLVFPSFIYQSNVHSNTKAFKSLNSQLLKESYKFSEIDKPGRIWSKKNYTGGYTSYGSLSQLYKISPYFEDLKNLLEPHKNNFLKKLELDCRPQDIQMCSLWINIMPSNVTHTMHIHPLSVISGTYYLQLPKDTRGLRFEDPRLTSFMARPSRKPKVKLHNQTFVEIMPKVNDVVLFESYMKHEVPSNPSSKDRISLSFNYDWV